MPVEDPRESAPKPTGSGEPGAGDPLLPLVYDELRALAGSLMRRERAGHTLQPTALVHEAWIRLAGEPGRWANRAHFMAVAARAMRRVLVDHARRHGADKRGGEWQRITLTGCDAAGDEVAGVDALDLERALCLLERLHERQARVVELRLLGGLDVAETARVLDVSESTVKDDWASARAFLAQELGRSRGGSA